MQTQNNESGLILIPQLKDKQTEVENIFQAYIAYAKIFLWIKIPIGILMATVAIYNIFFAGKRYSIEEYNTIKYTMIGICCLVALILVFVTIFSFIEQKKVRDLVKDLAKMKHMNYKALKKELNLVLKSNFKGPGI